MPHQQPASHRRSSAPAQRALDHEALSAATRGAFAATVAALRAEATALGARMADAGSIEVVERASGAQVLYRPHHGEGPHTLVGAFDLHLSHEGKAAIHMRIRGVVPPAEILDLDRATPERLRARLSVFEAGCRRVPTACAA